jgi:hypothetical protein
MAKEKQSKEERKAKKKQTKEERKAKKSGKENKL